MKIWITRKSASSLQFGGLERLEVWFQEPVYYYQRYKPYPDSPFSDGPLHYLGIRDDGWGVGSGPFQHCVPFSKMFGYADTEFEKQDAFTDWVWNELTKHFDNADFHDWHELERKNPEKYHKRKFLLHAVFDLDMSLKRVYDLSEEPTEKPIKS
jgi:hypothetical protein